MRVVASAPRSSFRSQGRPEKEAIGEGHGNVGQPTQMPTNQLQMMKLLVNQQTTSQGLYATQILGTVFDGITRHTREGYVFQQRAAQAGFKQAVRERDEPFEDLGSKTSRIIR
jgi:hypothetical protein